MRASDIHIEPREHKLAIRYRIDGALQDMEAPPAALGPALVSRVKIMARLDIAERRLPQDGRIRIPVRGRQIDMRVSTVPTIFGENVVMRVLDRSAIELEFAKLGFDDALERRFLALLDQPNGILLVTGPTGSGKTTTLYTALRHLNAPDKKLFTVEDPVEYQLDGREPDRDQAADRAQLRACAALDPAPGPRHRHDRRDPRRRDRRDRDPGRAYGASRAVDLAHQQRRRHGDAAFGHGRPRLSPDLDHQRHPGAAAGAAAVRELPRGVRAAARVPGPARLRGRRGQGRDLPSRARLRRSATAPASAAASASSS